MSKFQYPALVDLVQSINAANGTSFLTTDLSFGAPKETSGTWQGTSTDRNSAIKASAASAAYQGSKVILYNRRDLSQLANLPAVKLGVLNPSTVWDILPSIRFYLGVPLLQTDVSNDPITLNSDGTGNVTITALSTSPGWIGTVTLAVFKGGQRLSSAIATPSLAGVNYPVDDVTAPPASATYGPMYLYPYDFSANTSTFLGYAPGVLTQTQADAILAAIQAVDIGAGKSLWTATQGAATAWQLYGATIVSNGLNDPATKPTNASYKYVMELALDASVTTPSGHLYLHYNDPFNPDAF
jgi:hypothetical protein